MIIIEEGYKLEDYDNNGRSKFSNELTSFLKQLEPNGNPLRIEGGDYKDNTRYLYVTTRSRAKSVGIKVRIRTYKNDDGSRYARVWRVQ